MYVDVPQRRKGRVESSSFHSKLIRRKPVDLSVFLSFSYGTQVEWRVLLFRVYLVSEFTFPTLLRYV